MKSAHTPSFEMRSTMIVAVLVEEPAAAVIRRLLTTSAGVVMKDALAPARAPIAIVSGFDSARTLPPKYSPLNSRLYCSYSTCMHAPAVGLRVTAHFRAAHAPRQLRTPRGCSVLPGR